MTFLYRQNGRECQWTIISHEGVDQVDHDGGQNWLEGKRRLDRFNSSCLLMIEYKRMRYLIEFLKCKSIYWGQYQT